MKKKIEDLIPKIENLLSNSNYKEFYVGKTDDLEKRNKEHEDEGYNLFWEIAHGIPDSISEGEKKLINYFRNKSSVKDKCENENEGGGGNNQATFLYLAVRADINSIHDFSDDAIPLFDPLPEI